MTGRNGLGGRRIWVGMVGLRSMNQLTKSTYSSGCRPAARMYQHHYTKLPTPELTIIPDPHLSFRVLRPFRNTAYRTDERENVDDCPQIYDTSVMISSMTRMTFQY